MALNPQVYGVDQTIRVLKLVEPEFYKTARIDLRKAAEPIAVNIRAWIPDQAPLSGMKHNGRTGWNKAGVKVTVKQSFSKRTAARETSLVSIYVGGRRGTTGAAGLEIADMAGRRGKTATGMSRKYTRNGTEQRHRLNGQGAALIDGLSKRHSSASRFVWRGAMSQLPKVTADVLVILERVSEKTNSRLVIK
tara:strand:+ start:3137 stop:3712 length:576 start_codon:yes stop_codon:yes gene_type:complete